MSDNLTHIGSDGLPKMVDVGEKQITARKATARGEISMSAATLSAIVNGGIKKGDVLATAKIAAICAAKKTYELIPMCHNVPLDGCDVSFEIKERSVVVNATTAATAKTGVEMEAITAVSAALITIYDMAKAMDRGMVIGNIRLLEKSGGKSGLYRAPSNV